MFLHSLYIECQYVPRDCKLSHVCDCVAMSVIIYRIESVRLDVYIAHVSPGFSMVRDAQHALPPECSRQDSGAIRQHTTICRI